MAILWTCLLGVGTILSKVAVTRVSAQEVESFWVSESPVSKPQAMALFPQGGHAPKGSATLYSIGNPSDDEQYYLELINRARANPILEAQRQKTNSDVEVLWELSHHSINLVQMSNQIASIPSVYPLAFNANLLTSARGHASYMLVSNLMSHYEGTGTTNNPISRANNAGYVVGNVSENVGAYLQSSAVGHSSMEVDWADAGSLPAGYAIEYGMLKPPRHRENLHDWAPERSDGIYRENYQEAGIGVVNGGYYTNGSVGPQLVTQDFGWSYDYYSFVTGVAYYDLNGNNFYDPGEGVAGVTVTVDGGPHYAVTTNSGGYTVPVSSEGTYTVRMTCTNMTNLVTTAYLTNYYNAKVDNKLTYSPPAVAAVLGTNRIVVGVSNQFRFPVVPGAKGYQWRYAQTNVFNQVEGAESGTNNVVFSGSPGYAVVVTDQKRTGSSSFHLAHPQVFVDQILTMKNVFRGRTNSAVRFATMMGYANTNQVARFQISTNCGLSWYDIWSQKGKGTARETVFTNRFVTLTNLSGREFLARFYYDFISGAAWYPQTNSGYGAYLDDVTFTNVDYYVNMTTNSATTTNFTFNPSTNGNFFLRARPQVSNRYFDYGAEMYVMATNAGARIHSLTRPSPSQVRVDFMLTNGTPTACQLLWATQANSTWNRDTGAVLTTNLAPFNFRYTTTNGGSSSRYYRVSVY